MIYIFGSGSSIYSSPGGDASGNILYGRYDGGGSSSHGSAVTPMLSTMTLRDSTTVADIDDYGTKLQSDLNEIERSFTDKPNISSMKSYEQFIKIRVKLLEHTNKLKELYVLYEEALVSTPDRKFAIRNQIREVGLKISAIVGSYNRSGLLVDGPVVVSIPSTARGSYQDALKQSIIQNIT